MKQSRLSPDFLREYGDYRNLAKECEPEHIELVAERLDEARLDAARFMPVAEPEEAPAPPQIDPNILPRRSLTGG